MAADRQLLIRMGGDISELRAKLTEANGYIGRTAETVTKASETSAKAFKAAGSAGRDFAQLISGAAAVASLFARNNKQLQRELEVVSLTLSGATTMVRTFGSALNLLARHPVVMVLTGIALLSVAAVTLVRNWEVAVAAAQRAWKSLADFLAQLWQGIATAGRGLGQILLGALTLNVGQIQAGWAELSRGLTQMKSVAIDVARSVINIAEVGWKKLTDLFGESGKVAKKATSDAAARAEEKRFQDQANQIVAFNIWQREEWEKAAEARTKVTIAAIDRIIEEEERLKDETLDLIDLFNQQAIDAIREREQEALDAARTMLEAERVLAEEGADLIRRANQEVVDAIEAQMEAQRRAALQTAPLWVQQAEAARKAAEEIASFLASTITDALTDVFEKGKSIFDALADIARSFFNEVLRMLISFGVRSFLRFLGLPLEKGGIVQGGLAFAGMQHGGIVSRPTLAMVGEGSHSEAVVPLPDGRSIPVKSVGGDRGAARELTLNVIVKNVFDPEQMSQMRTSPSETEAVIVNNVLSRGAVFRAIRIAIPR